jgi:hypothetical protein
MRRTRWQPGRESGLLKRLGTRDDLDQFLGDIGLALAVIAQRQFLDQIASIARGAIHGRHLRPIKPGLVFQQRRENLPVDITRQQGIEDSRLGGLIEIHPALQIRLGHTLGRDDGDQLAGGGDLADHRTETGIDDAGHVKRALTEEEVVNAGARFFGTTSETFAAVIERVFNENGRPVGYIEGEEGSGAFVVGLRYGNGTLVLRNGARRKVFWQGPSLGFDAGGNASKVFTLVYGLNDPDRLYQRFPGVDGSAYVVAGIGVNYQRADEITLAPVRTGVGLRFGVNLGYLAYSRKQHANPF